MFSLEKVVNFIQLLFLDLFSFSSQIKKLYYLLLSKGPSRCHSCDSSKYCFSTMWLYEEFLVFKLALSQRIYM